MATDLWAVFDETGDGGGTTFASKQEAIESAFNDYGYGTPEVWWSQMKRKGWSVKRAKIVAVEGENG